MAQRGGRAAGRIALGALAAQARDRAPRLSDAQDCGLIPIRRQVVEPRFAGKRGRGPSQREPPGVDSRATVDRVYKKALELGGTDEGPAGPHGDDFTAGYFCDLNGNKPRVCCVE